MYSTPYEAYISHLAAAEAAYWQMMQPPTFGMYGGEQNWYPPPWHGHQLPQQRHASHHRYGVQSPSNRQRHSSRQRYSSPEAIRWPLSISNRCPSPGHTTDGLETRNRVHMPSFYGPKLGDAKDFPKERCEQLEKMLEPEAGNEDKKKALAQIHHSVWKLAITASGCRLVQAAINAASPKEAQELAEEMRGKVLEAVKSPHANYVIQAIIQALPTSSFIFIAEELHKHAAMFSRHKFGCRVMCRLLQHSSTVSSTIALVDEILKQAADLSRHSFGHYVMESILEHCQPRQKKILVESLKVDLLGSARSRNASFVIEKALLECDDDLRKEIAWGLLSKYEHMVSLAHSQPGYFVLLALLKLDEDFSQSCIQYLMKAPEEFQAAKYGKKLLEELGISRPEPVQITLATA